MSPDFITKNLELKDFDKFNKLMQQVHNLHVENRSDIYKATNTIIPFEEFNDIIYSDEKFGIGAYIDSELIGFCVSSIKTVPPNAAWHSRKLGIIEEFCVQADFRHMGIGSNLFENIKSLLEKKGIQSIELTVWDFNKSAFNFYKDNGMTVRSSTMELKL